MCVLRKGVVPVESNHTKQQQTMSTPVNAVTPGKHGTRSRGISPVPLVASDVKQPACMHKLSSDLPVTGAAYRIAGNDSDRKRRKSSIAVMGSRSPLKKKKAPTPDAPKKIKKAPVRLEKESASIPPPSRSIVENQALSDLVSAHANCRHCRKVGTLSMIFSTNCVASKPVLCCSACEKKNPRTHKGKSGSRLETNVPKRNNQNPVSSCDLNVKCALSFTLSGDGGTEAQRTLSLCGLPNSTTFRGSSMTKIEDETFLATKPIMDEALLESLIAEVKATPQQSTFDVQAWEKCLRNGEQPAINNRPFVSVSMDMGWQKRSSGRRYDSNSGHAFLVGKELRKPIAFCLKSKFCRCCTHWLNKEKDSPIPVHDCSKNHTGSSGSMESAALLEMIEELFFSKHTTVKFVITDDDSTMKANCRWTNYDWAIHHGVPCPKEGKEIGERKSGKLKYPVPEPKFLADPAHRKKTLSNHLWKLKKKGLRKENPSTGNFGLVEGDIVRLSRYYICMARQLKDAPREDWLNSGKAVLEHHFDNHEFCRSCFCKRKDQSEEERKACDKVYRSKLDDKPLHDKLEEIISPFISLQGLEDIAHGGDTQVNESLNNSMTWLAPKNKTISGSRSLANRVAICCCINLLGYDEFLHRLFQRMGLDMNDSTWYSIRQLQEYRDIKRFNSKLLLTKQKRNARVFAKLQEYFDKLLKDKAKDMKYETCTAMQPQKKRKLLTTVAGVTVGCCKKCGGTDHRRSSSNKCLFNKRNLSASQQNSDVDSVALSSEPVTAEHTLILSDEEDGYDETDVSPSNEFSLLDSIGLSTDTENVGNVLSAIDEIEEEELDQCLAS